MSTAQRQKAPSPKQLYDQQPYPLDAGPDEVENYVSSVQRRNKSAKDAGDRRRLRREVIAQIELAGIRASSQRDAALESLNRIFRLGSAPSTALDGTYRGIMVATSVHGLVDPLLRWVTNLYMPWVGKRFVAADSTGDNVLEPSARHLARLVWPNYKDFSTLDNGRLAGLVFKTSSGPGRLDPDRQTLALDYDQPGNPGFLVRNVLDELVEIVPGAYLGKFCHRRGSKLKLIGYFAVTDDPTE